MSTPQYLRAPEVAKLLGVSTTSVWRWHREDESFPEAIRLTARCTVWRQPDIVAWAEARGVAPAPVAVVPTAKRTRKTKTSVETFA